MDEINGLMTRHTKLQDTYTTLEKTYQITISPNELGFSVEGKGILLHYGDLMST